MSLVFNQYPKSQSPKKQGGGKVCKKCRCLKTVKNGCNHKVSAADKEGFWA